MPSLPRVVTVDPSGRIAGIVRSAMDLIGRHIVLFDAPNGPEALEEISRGRCTMVISNWYLSEEMQGLELALRTKQASPETAVLILGDVDDPEALDEEVAAESPFVYMSRPVDAQQFLRVLNAGLEGKDLREAMKTPSGPTPISLDMGPIPNLDPAAAEGIVDKLLTELGAMAIILSSRSGEVIMERGAVGYLDREQLTRAMLPVVMSNIEVRDVVGGQSSALQFFDGENYDVFVLTVGLHHFMCVAFDGEGGARQFGAVTRYGRRAVEDLIALLGANAWLIQRVVVEEEEEPAPARRTKTTKKAEEEAPLMRAEAFSEPSPAPVVEETLQLEPIQDLDLNVLFGQKVNASEADDLFDLEKLEEIARKSTKDEVIDFDTAMQMGLLPKG